MPSKDIILPATQRAIIATDAEGTLKISNDVPVVTLEPDAVIVETAALALNPVDTKMLHGFLGPGCILGFDFAGVIVAVGSAVPESRGLAIGGRVFGSANGSDRRRPLAGAFAQYTTCSASMIIKMHPDMTFTRAAALGTALTSTGMALFRSLCIPGTLDKPILKSTWLLVYGGATSTGTMMIQLARRCGFKPITTCSPANFNLVKSYGAEKAFDYQSSTCAEDIRKYTGNTLAYAADCVTVPSSTKACIAAIGRAGGRYVALDPYEEDLMTRKVVRPDWILATAVAGRGSSWPAPYGREPDMECRVWAEEYLASVERLIGSGADQIRSHPIEEREGGLEGIMSGIEEIRRKQHFSMRRFKAEPIAIIGSGCRFPGNASSPSKLWELLHHPRDVSRKIDRFNAAGFFNKDGHYHGASNVSDAYLLEEDTRTFDAQFFNIQAGEAENIDPQQRLLLETVYESLEAAGQAIENLKGSSTAVFVGCMVDDFAGITYHDSEAIPTYGATGISRAILSNRVSYVFDWRGPSMTIDTACSSSLVAIHQAMQVLRDGTSTMAIAAGVNLIFSPNMFIAESNLNMLSPSGKSQMWDADADGYARGEGISAVVLKPLSVAVADGDHIECVIRETALNQDGHTPGITMPSAAAQVRLIRDTYARAGLDLRKHADRCQYFEAHGTGTKAGDGVESRAIHDAFFSSDVDAQKMGPLLVGSVKTIIGHTEGSAGIAGVLRAALAIQNDTIPPNLHFNTLNPEIQPYYGRLRIATEATKWPEIAPRGVRRASVNSFGFGGANAHAILEGYDPGYHGHARHLSRPSNVNPLPFVLSATAEKSLKALVRQYIDYLYLNPDVNVHDLAWTLYHRRSIFPFRVTVPAHDVGDLIPRLEAILDENAPSSESSIVRATSSQKHLLGVFTGQGAQWATMGRDLIKSSQEAESIIDALVVALDQLPAPDRPSWNLKTELFADARNSRITESEISQPLCTAVQILLVNILRTAGVVFESVVGHSSGEIAAAYAAGFLSATDAVRIAYYRGRFAHLAQGSQGQRGTMIAVGTSIDDAVELVSLPAFDGRVSLAACNSSSSVTLSGDSDAVEEIQEVLQDESKFNRLLKVETAYHSHHMNACSKPYAKALQACEIKILQSNGHTKWYSSVHDGQLMESCEELRAEYWIKNMVNPVFFSAALGAALADPNANSPSLIVEFYSNLATIGYNYADMFKGITSLKRSAGQAAGTIISTQNTDSQPSTPESYLIHPSALDIAFQTIFAAVSHPGDGALWTLHIPTTVERIIINPSACVSGSGLNTALQFSTCSRISAAGGISGDVDIHAPDNTHRTVQIEGLAVAPVSPATESDDRQMFADTCYVPAIPDAHAVYSAPPEATGEEKRAALAFERLCFYYIRQLTGHTTRQDITTWAQRAVDMTALVKHPIAKPAWLSDTREMFESLVEQVDRNPVYQAGLEAVSTISKALEDDDAVPSTAVEYENLLHRFYETAYGAQRSRDHLTSLVRLIALRHPRIRILEICPADGAVTEQILQTLGESFSSYTISGLSAERFEELQDLSDTIKHRIILKDINLDQDTDDIAVPGGAFDVIISAHGLPTSDRALRMLRYLIKPGGYLAALQATNNDSLSLGLIARFLENSYTLTDDMNRLPDLEGWHGLLEANGFSGVDTATPDDLIPFSVFCSQAVDSAVEATRQPLSGNTTNIKDILIIGGRKFKVARVVDQTRKLLASTCGNIVIIKSLDLLEHSMVASKPMVLCLTELDDPLFKDLTNLHFANLQNLLSGCRQVLWVVQGASGSNPYANMMKGVFKTLLAEDPGLYVQFLNVEGKIDDCAQPFAEALVRIHLPQTWRSNYECLWTQERELTLRDGQFYISRYLPNRNLDLGYNTLRRKIHTMVNPYQDTVEIVAEGGKLELQRNRVNERPDESASAEEFVNVKVTHSIANAILIGNVGRLYLCAGIDQRTSNPVLVFSEHQQSILRVPSSRLVSFKLSSHKIEHLLVCIAANIIASSILENAATRGTVMVHEPEKPLEMMILQKSLASAFTPVFTTSDPRHAGEANWLVVHPHAPSRVIRKIVPKDVSLFVSCSTNNQLANETNVQRCLLPGVRRISIADFAHSASTKCSIPDDESQTILQNAYQEALSSLEGPDSFEAPIKVPLHELSDGKPVTSTFSTIDWTTKGAVRARVRSAMEEVTFNAHKTYLLIGMTGSMGISTVMYMITRGARSFALASRSPKVDQIWLENTQTEYGAVIRVFSLDITSRESLHKVHQEISKSMLPIGGVANAALVIRDALFVDMDAEKMNESLGPKVTGTLLLDELFQSVNLDFFILYSSLVYITGNQGQTAYCAGNGFLVSQAHGRRSRGLTASVMNLAGISGIGFITRNDHSILDRLDLLGYGVISENDYLYLFAEAVLAGPVDSGRSPEVSGGLRFVDMAKDKHPPVWTSDPTFTHYLLDRSSAGDGESLAASSTSMKSRLLEAKSANEIFDIVLSSFAGLLHKQLRLSPEDSVPSDAAIVELGVDSLVAVQIRQWFMDELEISIPVMKILGGATIFDLVEGAVGEISPSLIPQVSQDQSVSPIHEQGSANDVNSTAEGDTESDSRINTSPSSVSNDDFLHVSDDGLSTPMTSSNSEDWSIVPMLNQKKHELLDRPNTEKSRPRIQRKVKMAFAATRFWFLRQYLQDDACFNVVFRVHITGDVDVMKFDEAVKRLGRRHEAFRTCFYVDEETQEPTQGVMADSRLRLERKSVGGEAEAAEETAMLKNHPFDIEHGDVARIAWLTVNPTDHYLVIACHHIAIDGFSNNVLLTELDLLYRDQRLSPVHLQFTDFAVQQRQEVETGRMAKELAFWRSVYPSVPDPLPLFPLSGVQSRQPLTTYGHLEASTTLNKEMASRIRTGVRSVHCTFFHFMLAAFEVFLFRFLETEELVIGIADANRDDLKTLSTVGFLLNLLPLRFQSPESDATFAEVLRRAKDIARAALDNSRLPFDVILNELDVPRSSTYSPLFQVFLDYKQVTAKAPPMLKAKAQGERFNGETGYDLVLDIVDVAGGDVNITLRAQKSLYPDHVEILLDSFMRLVHVFTDDLGTAAGSVQLFGEAERKKAIQLGRGLSMPLSWPETMSLRIEDMVKQYPEDLAVRDAFGLEMTYSVMQETVAKISQRILQEGAAYGTRISVFQEPSALWICSLLAIWTLGCVYLPLDPKRGLPALSSIVASAQPGLILVSSDTVAESNALADKVPVVNVDRIQEGPRVPPVQNRSKGSGVAVILFTSGSTGKPKGIEVGHAGLVNLLEGYSRSFNVERPAVLQHTTYSFDIALDQILSGLGLGGSLYVASAAERRDPRLLASAIKRMNLTYTKATPSEYVAWIDSGHDLLAQATAWERALIGGENWNDTLRLAFQNLNLPSLRLQNCYGPTESTINCAKKEIPLDQTITTLSAGTALPNTSIYILDDQLCPVPCGVLGEVVISGAGTALSYLQDPALTAEKFILDRHASQEYLASGWTRAYRTGDLGYLNNDGSLVIVGRINGDTQVKLRGVRIELEDIESNIVKTSGGAISRATASNATELTETESKLRQIWLDLFAMTTADTLAITKDSNFFNSGGNSIMSIQLQRRIHTEFSVSISLPELLESGTISELGSLITSRLGTEIDWKKETKLDQDLTAAVQSFSAKDLVSKNERPKSVLLTGASGFVGRHVLQGLIANDSVTSVHCVAIRPSSAQDPKRIALMELQATSTKVHVYEGDLGAPRLGLSEILFKLLANEVDAIIHCGANRSFWEDYASLRDVNTSSTRELIRMASIARLQHQKATSISFVSTGEKELAAAPGTGSNGYVTTKWVSERLLEQASTSFGLVVNIHRLQPMLDPNATDEERKESVYAELIDLIYRMKLLPSRDTWNGRWDLTPVTVMSDTIVRSALERPIHAGTHYVPLMATISMTMDEVLARLPDVHQSTDGTMVEVPGHQWIGRAKEAGFSYQVTSMDVTLQDKEGNIVRNLHR
ncbi:hypothetical protein E4T39_02233 [Aureobasidium subglaciale]|nr:hypothetical protein E4T39_02233 [Aureobasidium subglaciale]